MKMTINIDCTPEEARQFLGLPNVDALNEMMVDQLKLKFAENLEKMQPEEMMKAWSGFGIQAQDQFFKMMQGAAQATMSGLKGG